MTMTELLHQHITTADMVVHALSRDLDRTVLISDTGQVIIAGEICVRGPLLMAGYLNKPEETAAAFEGGWLHTGDVAVRSPDGFLRIVDRTKDMIITGGCNVYAREVEDVIVEQPGVLQAAVIGFPIPNGARR